MSKLIHCVHDEFCGGCIYDDKTYEEQLKIKEESVLSLLEEKGAEVKHFDGICGREDHQIRYRNKMEYTFGDLVKDGPLCLGMHKIRNFMSIVTVDNCLLVDEDFNKILRYTLDFATERGYKHYHKRAHEGLLRNLVVRKGVRTKELLINIVTSSEEGFDEKAWVEGILNLPLQNKVVGILRTFNDNPADAVICESLKQLYGRDYYMEEICGLKFKVSAFSFFQTNVEAVEKLYFDAVSLIENIEGKNVFDLYCGTGTISQIMAQKANHVLGIELVEEAVEAAKANAKLNRIENCEFIAGDVFEVLSERKEIPDVIVVDPPRVGMSPKAVEKIAKYGVQQIVYVSCNPKTLAMNLQQFSELGYEAEYLKAYDNFPRTKHTEAVCLLRKQAEDVELFMEHQDELDQIMEIVKQSYDTQAE